MSYIVEQKIKGNIYLYTVENKWDKEKKKTFQKRTYIGPKNSIKRQNYLKGKTNLINKNYGNIFFLRFLSEKLGIDKIVKNCFPTDFNEIIALIYYDIMEGSPTYLFEYWHDENYLPEVKKLDSSACSSLYEKIGRDEVARQTFIEEWVENIKPIKALYFDITSISSHSNNISYIEWGYNRDKEEKAQLNIGLVYCEEKKLPLCYFIYPGSIVDVSTLRNCKKYLNNYGLIDFMFILDRGFFSTANILNMNEKNNRINFIQPLSFSLKKTKELIKRHRNELTNLKSAFSYKEDILNYVKSSVSFDDNDFDAHLFYNEKAELDARHNLLSKLFEIQKTILDKTFPTQKEFAKFKNDNIIEKYREFYKWNKLNLSAEINQKQINNYLSNSGYYVMATNKTELIRDEILSHYRNKDLIEKTFDIIKNEMDGKRLRTHNDFTTLGKIFKLFISSIIMSEITRVMNQNELFKVLTIKEVLYELRKIKINNLSKDGNPIISEISKKQRKILECFNIEPKMLYGY